MDSTIYALNSNNWIWNVECGMWGCWLIETGKPSTIQHNSHELFRITHLMLLLCWVQFRTTYTYSDLNLDCRDYEAHNHLIATDHAFTNISFCVPFREIQSNVSSNTLGRHSLVLALCISSIKESSKVKTKKMTRFWSVRSAWPMNERERNGGNATFCTFIKSFIFTSSFVFFKSYAAALHTDSENRLRFRMAGDSIKCPKWKGRII